MTIFECSINIFLSLERTIKNETVFHRFIDVINQESFCFPSVFQNRLKVTSFPRLIIQCFHETLALFMVQHVLSQELPIFSHQSHQNWVIIKSRQVRKLGIGTRIQNVKYERKLE